MFVLIVSDHGSKVWHTSGIAGYQILHSL